MTDVRRPGRRGTWLRNWGAGTRTPIPGTKTRCLNLLDDPPNGPRSAESTSGDAGVREFDLSDHGANIRSCLGTMNNRHARRLPPHSRMPRRCERLVCARLVATTRSSDGTSIRSGRSRPTILMRRALSAADSGGGWCRSRRCSSNTRLTREAPSKHACSSAATSRGTASCADKARSGVANGWPSSWTTSTGYRTTTD